MPAARIEIEQATHNMELREAQIYRSASVSLTKLQACEGNMQELESEKNALDQTVRQQEGIMWITIANFEDRDAKEQQSFRKALTRTRKPRQ